MQAVTQLNAVAVDTGKPPTHGSKAIPITYDFSQGASWNTDLSLLKQQGKIGSVQSVFIDNSQNNQTVTITMTGLGQRISVPAGYQGIFPVFVTDKPVFTVDSAGNGIATIAFSNAHQNAAMWATSPSQVNVSGTIATTNAALDPTVSGNRINTTSKPAVIAYTDRSGTVAAAGVSQQLLAANANRVGFIVMNIDAVNQEDMGINLTGGAASIGAAGTLTLAASGGAGYPGGSFQGAGTGAITVVAATAGHKFTCVEW